MDLEEIKRLIQLVKRTRIGELEVTEGGRTIRITARASAAPASVHGAPPPASPAAAPAATAAGSEAAIPADPSALWLPVVSPMVGTFYRSPAPDADPYVEMNTQVEVGQTVCIIEAMKLMNEIESEFRGRIAKILVENGQPVEFGQTLFLIDPS